jgi:hypothetical protein
VTMKASALSAAIPILGRSAEDPKQMKRGDPFGLVLRVGSVQRLDLPEPGQAEKHVAPEPQTGLGSEPFVAGQRRVAAPSDIEGKLSSQRANALGTGALPVRPHQTQVWGSGDRSYLVQAPLLSR